MVNSTDGDRYNLCVHLFVEHDYDGVIALSGDLLRRGTSFAMHMIVLLAALELRKVDLVHRLGAFLLTQGRILPWEQAIVRLVIGNIEDADLLAQADGAERQCQANYYIGARYLTQRNFVAAQRHFVASLAILSSCVEHEIVKFELKHFERYTTFTETPASSLANHSDAEIWEFDTLLAKLSSEHRPTYVYRGQNRDYSSLLPSGYRPRVDMTQPAIQRRDIESLHNRGGTFRPLLPHSLWPDSERKRIDFVSLCRAQFGYPVSQLFCQHCCLPTEGLDVSHKLEVAAFFAIFDYSAQCYAEQTKQPGAIYRTAVESTPSLSLARLKDIDFYSCPFFLSGVDILNSLGRCLTESTSLNSLSEYFSVNRCIDTGEEGFEPERKNRPLELIRLAEEDVQKGRVMTQQAGLIFPDSFLPRSFQARSFPPPAGKTWEGPHCIEDLAKSPLIETFRFRQSPANAAKLDYDPGSIFPEIDPLRSLLQGLPLAISRGMGNFGDIIQDASFFSAFDDEEMAR